MFDGMKILVCGMARSGVSSAKLLKRLGATVTLSDTSDKLGDLPLTLEKEGYTVITGRNPDDSLLNEQDLVVISPGIPYDLPFLMEARRLGIRVWGEMELAAILCRCPILAITGTNGKTTTTTLMGDIIRYFNKNVKVCGNIGLPFTEVVYEMEQTDLAVLEVSSFQLETIQTFRPHIAAILNLTPDHLNRHKTFEEYVRMKARIFENQTKDDFLILNYDDENCRKLAALAKSKVIFFSRKTILDEGVFVQDNAIYANIFNFCGEVLSLDLIPLTMIGTHSVENVLAAVSMSLCVPVTLMDIKRGVSGFKGAPHRLEYVREFKGVLYYNDSKGTNPDSAIKSVEAIEKPIILIGGGYDKGVEFDEWVRLFPGRVKLLIVLGEVTEKIIECCKAYNFFDFERVNSLKDAVDLAYAKAIPGDCVLLSPACASWDMFDNFEQRGDLFKDFVHELGE